MGGTSKSTSATSQSQQSETNPWAPTQGLLNGVIGGINGQVGNAAPTGAENGALSSIMQNAQGAQNYGGQATSLANSLMAGGGTGANAGMLGDAYKNYQQQLSPYANGQNLDPSQNPATAAMIDRITNQVGNSINGQFAGAGRDMSGMNQKAIASGLSEGLAPTLFGQYNQNVQNQLGAAGSLFNAGGQTASGLQNFNQQGFQNQATGLDTALNGIPAAQNNQSNQILQAQAQARGLPLQNLGMLEGLTIPLAGLGGTSSGTSTGNTQGSYTMSPVQQAQGWAGVFSKLFPGGL